MSKEYTYDIGKYTIGVDTNGEDGIGMTIAIIKNGEINFLGNCYGENARCIDLLIKENQELKAQLKEQIKEYQKAVDKTMSEKIDIENNWNKLKKYIKTEIPEDVFIDTEWFVSILDKIHELEQGSDYNE